MDKTTEFSFVLKPSEHGIGVFAVHDIKEGTYLRLFGNDDKGGDRSRDKKDVPESFRVYCIDKGDKLITPADFGAMPVGWFMNHSKNPNALNNNYHYYAAHDIKAGEEITIDYNSLESRKKQKKIIINENQGDCHQKNADERV
ncbi:MAG TPA: SET domain-containing protein [Candidatus Paceibacterota bacterium]|nr:SET domain-containing protein [Candidatus Paceibacterota bacterium]